MTATRGPRWVRRSRRTDDTTRPLPRPDEDLVDQGLAFDLGTMIDRRRALRTLGLGAAVTGIAAIGARPLVAAATTDTTDTTGGSTATTVDPSTLPEIPDETAGPYPGDGSNGPDVLEQTGVVRQDITTSFGDASGVAEGVPMTLELTILDVAGGGAGMAGAAVYAWHCTRDGLYSMYSEGAEDENVLRGVQIADDAGKVTFASIFPGCYSGRWPHVHFEVYPDEAAITDSTNAIATSQVALPQAACDVVYAEEGYESSIPNLAQLTLDTDNVFGDDGGVYQLGATTGDVAEGYRVQLTVPVDTTTEPTGATMAGGGSGGPGGGGTPPTGGRGPGG
ncbi:MAG: 3,4-dioxygenase subunit beta [Desertimonas sp.]